MPVEATVEAYISAKWGSYPDWFKYTFHFRTVGLNPQHSPADCANQVAGRGGFVLRTALPISVHIVEVSAKFLTGYYAGVQHQIPMDWQGYMPGKIMPFQNCISVQRFADPSVTNQRGRLFLSPCVDAFQSSVHPSKVNKTHAALAGLLDFVKSPLQIDPFFYGRYQPIILHADGTYTDITSSVINDFWMVRRSRRSSVIAP